jgi:hypothetical protein
LYTLSSKKIFFDTKKKKKIKIKKISLYIIKKLSILNPKNKSIFKPNKFNVKKNKKIKQIKFNSIINLLIFKDFTFKFIYKLKHIENKIKKIKKISKKKNTNSPINLFITISIILF